MCGPAFAALQVGATVADLPELPLLHIDWVAPDWVTWGEALRQDVVLAWHRKVAPMIAR